MHRAEASSAKHRVENPGYNDTKSAFADSSPSEAPMASIRAHLDAAARVPG